MYDKGTILAFIPVVDFFISMKMAFGKIVSTIYLILSIIACAFYIILVFLFCCILLLFYL